MSADGEASRITALRERSNFIASCVAESILISRAQRQAAHDTCRLATLQRERAHAMVERARSLERSLERQCILVLARNAERLRDICDSLQRQHHCKILAFTNHEAARAVIDSGRRIDLMILEQDFVEPELSQQDLH